MRALELSARTPECVGAWRRFGLAQGHLQICGKNPQTAAVLAPAQNPLQFLRPLDPITLMKSTIKLLLLTVFAGIAPALMAAGEWSMPNDFDSIAKPGSQWSAGRADIDASGSFRAFTDIQENDQWKMWNFADADVWGNGLVWLAVGPAFGTEPGEAAIHPGTSPDKATAIRWTAPNGTPKTTYRVTGLFRILANAGDRDVIIRLGNQTLLDKRAITEDQEFDLQFSASAGQSLDFIVGCGESWTNEATGFSATITQKSAPAGAKSTQSRSGIPPLSQEKSKRQDPASPSPTAASLAPSRPAPAEKKRQPRRGRCDSRVSSRRFRVLFSPWRSRSARNCA